MSSEPTTRSRREEYAEATRLALIEAGTSAFAETGFQSAGIEDISRAARVTRGAFYHHFPDKRALYEAVTIALQANAARTVEHEARKKFGVWDQLAAGLQAYLDICLDPAYQRIVVKEAIVALGYDRARRIEETYSMAPLRAAFEELQQSGDIIFEDIDLLCRMVDAMICKLSVILPDAPDPAGVRRNGQTIVTALIAAFRPSAS